MKRLSIAYLVPLTQANWELSTSTPAEEEAKVVAVAAATRTEVAAVVDVVAEAVEEVSTTITTLKIRINETEVSPHKVAEER